MKKVPVVMIQCVKKIMMKRKVLWTLEDEDSGHKCSRRDYEEDYMMTATDLVTVMVMMILPLHTDLVSH